MTQIQAKTPKYACSEAAIRREIEAALRERHRREAEKLRREAEQPPSHERVKSFLMPEKASPLVRFGDAVSGFVSKLQSSLVRRADLSSRLDTLMDKAAKKVDDDSVRLLVVERLIDEMSRVEQRLEGNVVSTKRAATIFAKRASRNGKAKNIKAAQAIGQLADVATKEMAEFVKVKTPRLVILTRLKTELESLVHDYHAEKRSQLLMLESELSVAMAENAVANMDRALTAAKKYTQRAAAEAVIEPKYFPQIVVLNEDIFIPFEKQVSAMEELARQSQQTVEKMPPVELDTMDLQQLSEFSLIVEEAFGHVENVCLEAKKMEAEMASMVQKNDELKQIWCARLDMAIENTNPDLVEQIMSRVKQYEDSLALTRGLLSTFQKNSAPLQDRMARLEKVRLLIAGRLENFPPRL